MEQKRGEMWHMDNERAGVAVQKVRTRLDNSIVGQCATTGQVNSSLRSDWPPTATNGVGAKC